MSSNSSFTQNLLWSSPHCGTEVYGDTYYSDKEECILEMLTWYFPKSERSQPCSGCFDQKFCLVDILCYTGWHYAGTSGAKRVQENKLAGFRNRALNSIQWGNQDVLESRQGDWRQWDIPVPCPHGRHEEGRQHGLGHASILL